MHTPDSSDRSSPLSRLSPSEQYWTLRSTAWMDRHWDPDARLLWYPDRTRGYSRQVLGPIHIVRETVWYAVGLLLRRKPGDLARAFEILESLEQWQFNAPGEDFHGTFCRYPREVSLRDLPPGSAQVAKEWWIHFDPNWREFIGLTLMLILEDFADVLPAPLVAKIDAMLLLATDGAFIRGVPAVYTNVALMSAALLEGVGRRNGRLDWIRQGETLAQEIFDRFTPTGVVDEFNSPTYYGVSLGALGHYRRPGVSPVLRRVGAAVEASLWRDLSHFYHPGLRNLCGPFDRAYGVDMLRCISATGIWIALAVDPADAPLPDFDRAFDQLHDLCFTPYFALLGVNCPPGMGAALTTIPDGRIVVQPVSQDPPRVATAWLGRRLMLGAQTAQFTRPAMGQVRAATVHWESQDGRIGWISVRSPHAVDAEAAENRLTVKVRRLAQSKEPLHAVFEIMPPGAESGPGPGPGPGDLVQRDKWRVTGLTVDVETNAGAWEIEPAEAGYAIRYACGEGEEELTCTLKTSGGCHRQSSS